MFSAFASQADEKTLAPERRPTARISGYDFARAIAIFGMVVVHFILVLARNQDLDTAGSYFLLELLDGRAAALFVVLAGIGVTLRGNSAIASSDRNKLRKVQVTLVRRGVFLLAAGFLNLAIWPGDILRVYGVSLLLAPWLLTASKRQLLCIAATFVGVFIVLMGLFDYERHWDWNTMSYHDLWTADGLLRNLFYNGFRSVFPWTGILIFGMWLGRTDARAPEARRKMLVWGVGVWVTAEALSKLLLASALQPASGMDAETAHALLGTGSMPPLPLFLLSSCGASVAIIALSLMLAETAPTSRFVKALVDTGRLAFTWYVAHIVLGLGTIEALGLTGTETPERAALAAVAFFATAVAVSWFWLRRFRHGPLEWLMRAATD